MKMGSGKTGAAAKLSGTARSGNDVSAGPTGGTTADASLKKLSELADSARREQVARAPLQPSMKDKLLISRNRAAEIRQRIQEGYYSRPEVVRSIADRLTDFIVP